MKHRDLNHISGFNQGHRKLDGHLTSFLPKGRLLNTYSVFYKGSELSDIMLLQQMSPTEEQESLTTSQKLKIIDQWMLLDIHCFCTPYSSVCAESKQSLNESEIHLTGLEVSETLGLC